VTKKKVLICEDSEIYREWFQQALSVLDTEITFLPGGFGVMQKVRELNPDLIILDVQMPGLGGPPVCKLIRSKDYGKDVPIIFLSDSDPSLLQELVDDCGATGYLMKSEPEPDLINSIRRYLGL